MSGKQIKKKGAKGSTPVASSYYVRFYSSESRDYFLLDPRKSRYQRADRRIKAFCDLFQDFVPKGCVYMLTLTVAKAEDQERALRDRSRFWNSFSQRIRRRGYKILGVSWVLEFQRRGVRHWHFCFVVDRPLYARKVPSWLKADLGLWSWGFTNIVRVERSLRGYLRKYFTKAMVYLQEKLLPGERLYYVRVCAEKTRSVLYRLSRLPWSVAKQAEPGLVDFIEHEQDGDRGYVFIYLDRWVFVCKPKFIFAGIMYRGGAI